MAKPTTKFEFGQYCLRSLGDGVININVSEAQLEDRIEEALQYWQDYHTDAVTRTYLKHEVTQADLDNEYITLSNDVISVVRVLKSNTGYTFGETMWDPEYQLYFNGFGTTTHPYGGNAHAPGIVDYEMSKQYLSMIDLLFTGMSTPIEFNRLKNQVDIDIKFENRLTVGETIVFEVLMTVNEGTYTNVWNDPWLKSYATALIKRQWGSNLSKMENLQLPGGVTLNGTQILQDAKEEIRELREEMKEAYNTPQQIYIG